MKKTKMYRYLGRNGILTTHVLLEGVSCSVIYQLAAEEGKILTNGEKNLHTVSVYEEHLDDWHEIDDPEANLNK